MFTQRKGITPVIAIVLLLLVTVGAVGVVYTQFQSLVGPGVQNPSQNTARQTEISITSVSKNSENQMNLTITNDQGSVTINTTEILELYFYPNQASPSSAVAFENDTQVQNLNFSSPNGATCFQPDHEVSGTEVVLDPGESLECDTNTEWPSATQYVGLDVRVQGGSQNWPKRCDPLSSNSETC